MLIISDEKDQTVPWAISEAAFKRQPKNEGVTEFVEMPNREHTLTIDNGWERSSRYGSSVRKALRIVSCGSHAQKWRNDPQGLADRSTTGTYLVDIVEAG